MKKRIAFVSNSSSSSYLIAREPGKPIKVIIELPIKKTYHKAIHTVEELNAMFDEDYDDWQVQLAFGKGGYVVDKYKKLKAALDAGKELVWVSGSNEDDDAISQLIYYGLDAATFLNGEEIVDHIP